MLALSRLCLTYGTVHDIGSQLHSLDQSQIPTQGVRGLRKSLALLACQERHAEALELCLEQGGFTVESILFDAADAVVQTEDPETYRVIWSCPDLLQLRQARDSYAEKTRNNDPAVAFDRGGRFPVEW